MPPTQTDWELIQRDPQLSDYTSAVATDPQLVELINGDNVITVFAPTNSAIAQVPNWDAIVADPAALDSFVRSHAVAGALTVDQLFAGTTPTELTTLNGETLMVDPVQRTINGAHDRHAGHARDERRGADDRPAVHRSGAHTDDHCGGRCTDDRGGGADDGAGGLIPLRL